MRTCIIAALTTTLGLSLGGCPNGPASEPDGIFLAPRIWAQFGCDGESSSFNAVHTTLALAPLKAWSAAVGEMLDGGPVVGSDGSLFVCNLAGEVVALTSSGTERWRRKVDHTFFSPPATDIETGDVYVLGQSPVGDNGFTSRIFRLTSGGGLVSISAEPFTSGGNLKIWDGFVFVVDDRELLAFDKSNLTLVSRQRTGCIDLVCGDVPLSYGVQFAICMATFVTSEIVGVTDECIQDYQPPGGRGGVSIVDSESLVGDPQQPVVVIATDQCVNAFRFHPSGDGPKPFNPHFEPLWARALVPVDCDFRSAQTSAPAVIVGGQVVVGRDNDVLSLDLMSGEELWRRDIGSTLTHPAAAALRQIYLVTSDHRLVILDSDGDFLSEMPLNGAGGAALSLDFVYVATTAGIHSLELDPTNGFGFDSSIATPGFFGTPSPVIGGGGSVFVGMPNGFVHAYAPSGFLNKPTRVPQVDWNLVAGGDFVSAGTTPELSVAVIGTDGGDFVGTVEFSSDLDGLLCRTSAQGGRAACTPSQALSVGTHLVTAFALDESGGANLSRTTLTVAAAPDNSGPTEPSPTTPAEPDGNSPPNVDLITPVNGGVFVAEDLIQFTVMVDDPDELEFDLFHVIWRSSLDGELGNGLILNLHLSVGTHEISVTATDLAGAVTTRAVTILVNP